MRLLHRDDDGVLSLTEDLANDGEIPPYAILSHRWSPEEVTYRDFVSGKSTDKAGYGKIEFCSRQSAIDGLRYFWIDTCCINKADSAELFESINSMFRWYQNAGRCYVYMSDVGRSGQPVDNRCPADDWEGTFKESSWFTRGWTLQELLAPTIVDFYTAEGVYLGTKASLGQIIHSMTGVPLSALSRQHLRKFSLEERFSWMTSRQTSEPEDKAYSLLGVFEVQMSLLYGEGEEKAMKRLRKTVESARQSPADIMFQQKLFGLRQWLQVANPADQPRRHTNRVL
jgi:hypothetical protein